MKTRRDDRVLSRFSHHFACVPALLVTAVWGVSSLCLTANGEVVEIRPALIEKGDSLGIEYRSGSELVGRSTDAAPAGVELLLPGAGATPVAFQTKTAREGVIELGPAKVGTLRLRWRIMQKTPSLVERTLEVTAEAAQRFAVTFPLDVVWDGEFASFTGPEKARTLYDTVRGSAKIETFPVAMVRTSHRVFGIVADSPGLWENRCLMLLDPPGHRLAVLTGDGRAPYPLIIKPPEDARDTYQYQMDGWQSLVAGETRRFTTWVFASPARSHYDAQVAAHLAVANGKGWNSSALEALLRNTSLFLLRRNLALDANNQPRDGRYIFISGPGYGWKQWVSDGFYTALGLDDPEKTIESQRAVFWTRMDYEDNSQYYLIWAVLMKRAGGTVNEPLARRAYEFLRRHEEDGFYIPPPLPGSPNPRGWKTYHDVLLYDDDDCPTSNQGFHCGALLAACTFRKQQTSLILVEIVKARKNGSPVRVFAAPLLNRRTKDGSVSAAEGMAAVGRLARRRIARSKSLAVVCHHHGDRVRDWPTNRHHVAPCRRGE